MRVDDLHSVLLPFLFFLIFGLRIIFCSFLVFSWVWIQVRSASLLLHHQCPYINFILFNLLLRVFHGNDDDDMGWKSSGQAGETWLMLQRKNALKQKYLFPLTKKFFRFLLRLKILCFFLLHLIFIIILILFFFGNKFGMAVNGGRISFFSIFRLTKIKKELILCWRV